uniref:F-box C protein n=1 Tax=Panagrellus redivivus TaxID=6233 RepID=A0A7E4V0Y3_PANRE
MPNLNKTEPINCVVVLDLLNLLLTKTNNLEDVIPFVLSSKTAFNEFQNVLKRCSSISTTTVIIRGKHFRYNVQKHGSVILPSAVLYAPVVQINGLIPADIGKIFAQRKKQVHIEYLTSFRHGLQLSKYPIVSSIKLYSFNDKMYTLFAQCPHVQKVEVALDYRSKEFIFPAVKDLTLELITALSEYRVNLAKNIPSATRYLTIKNANPRVFIPLTGLTDFFSLSLDKLTINFEFHNNYYSGPTSFVQLASTFPDDVSALLKDTTNKENRVHVLYRWNMLNRSTKVALADNFVQKVEAALKPKGFKQIECDEQYGIAFKVELSEHVDCTLVIICYYEYTET